MSAEKKVQGFCPACRRGTLFLGEGGCVTCSFAECPDPDAANELLEGGGKYLSALRQINVVRSSITARQSLNWSLHIYPLVQALDEAGIESRRDEVAASLEENTNGGYEVERKLLEAEGLYSGSLGSKRP